MQHVYEGKTKTVFRLDDGNYLLKFKDDVTGVDGVFDPGSNTVGLSIEGMGRAGLRMSAHFFAKIIEAGVYTHYITHDVDEAEMTVRPGTAFGKGVEVICRFRAVGSFLRRYGDYCAEGQALPGVVEMTLKDDDRGDPLIVKEALAALGILTEGEYDELADMTRRISGIIAEDLKARGVELYDIKLEFGRDGQRRVMLIDEISAGNMRALRTARL